MSARRDVESRGYAPGDTVIVCGPLYHGAPAMLLNTGLLNDSLVVLMERFEAARAVRLIEEHKVQFVFSSCRRI